MKFRYRTTSFFLLLTVLARGSWALEPAERSPLFPGELPQQAVPDPGEPPQEANVPNGLHITVLEGEDAVNIVKKKTAVQPVVEVRDRNKLPVAGATIIFSSPHSGASVTFLNGARSFTVITDSNGRAAAVGLKPINTGKFQINVSASYHSQTATAKISMTNYLTAAAAAGGGAATGAAGSGGLSAGMIGVIVGVGAAAAVGIGVGLSHHGSSSSSTTSIPTATIGVGGSATPGAPH